MEAIFAGIFSASLPRKHVKFEFKTETPGIQTVSPSRNSWS